MIDIEQNTKFSKLVTAVVVLSPIFKNYGFSFILFNEIILFALILLSIMKKKKFELTSGIKSLFVYTIVAGITTIFSIGTHSAVSATIFTTFFRFLFFVICIIYLVKPNFNMEFGYKVYLYGGVINCAYMLLQYITYELSKKRLQWNISGIPVKLGEGSANGTEIFGAYRASGFFSEPAHFCNYLIPLLLLILLYTPKTFNVKKMPLAIFVSACILMTKSGSGSILIGIIWMMYIYQLIKSGSGTRFAKAIVLALAIYFCAIPFISSSNLNKGYERVFADSNLSSINVRVYRGFVAFNKFPEINKIIGVGYGNYGSFVQKYHITTKYDLKDSSYVNSAAYVLCGTGIIGFIFYLLMFIDLLMHTKGLYRDRVIILFITAFFSGSTLTIDLLLSYGIILSGYKNSIENTENKMSILKDKI